MTFPFELPLLLDGATGTSLFAAGMPQTACAEEWALAHPQAVTELQRAYVRAGSAAVYTPTLCANAISLAGRGHAGEAAALNRELTALSRAAVGEDVLLGGDMGPTCEACEPFGEGLFLEHVCAYAEQALTLRAAGADFLVAETMTSLCEARAALLGAWQARLPVFVTLTVDERGRTPHGADALAALIALQALGAAAFGFNCCTASVMEEQLLRVAPYAQIPLIAKPNAGLPDASGAYALTPRAFAEDSLSLLRAGARILGGCCGTTPAHIAAMAEAVRGFDVNAHPIERAPDAIVVCNDADVFFLSEDFELSEPIACALDMTDAMMAAEDAGCDALCITVASNEDAHCFSLNAHMARLPVSFLAANEEALEEALIFFNGRAIVDSRSQVERTRLEELAAGYGAVLR